ncbi:MAG: ribosome recycling factor [Candidatus Vogelbacteria bacterium]|nr:ribosome recycling factor [Candidatus Vogelbacteria bacterium]
MQYDFSSFKKALTETEAWLSKEFSSLRSGRATPALLDRVQVDSYGSKMPISHVGSISIEDARTLRVTPWDKALVKSIETAIASANIGVSTASDDNGVRVIFPEMTEENRKKMGKIIRERFEDARIRVRTSREEVWSDIQARERASELSEDDKFRLKDELQKLVTGANERLDTLATKKENEILE